MRYGKYGQRAKEEVQSFDIEQQRAIQRAAVGREGGEGIAGRLNPERAPGDFHGRCDRRSGLTWFQSRRKNADRQISAAWRETENIEALPSAYRDLGPMVTKNLEIFALIRRCIPWLLKWTVRLEITLNAQEGEPDG